MEPMRGESCPAGQGRGPAASAGDIVPSPEYKPFHTHTTSTTRGRKRTLPPPPGSIPPRKVLKPQPHGPISDFLGLLEPACGESYLTKQFRGATEPGDYNVTYPDRNSFHTYTTPTTLGRNEIFPGSTPPRKVCNPQLLPTGLYLAGAHGTSGGDNCPPRQRQGPDAPGDDKVLSPDHKSFHTCTTSTTRRRNPTPPGSILPRKA